MVTALVLVAFGLAPPAPVAAQAEAPQTWNTELVGHLAPDQRGPFADVWAHRDVAYLGSLRSGDCRPPSGVWAIDLRDPARPRPLASFAEFPGSDGEDVWVGSVRTPASAATWPRSASSAAPARTRASPAWRCTT
jgi:hypothetical protein